MAATCILCPIYRPDTDPRLTNRPPVCEGDRWRLGHHIGDIARLHSLIVNPEPIGCNKRWYQARYQTWNPETKKWVRHWETRRADPLAAFGGAGPTAGRTNQPHVSGTPNPGVPIRVDDVDLTAVARRPNLTDQARLHPGDQIGHLSVATVLSEICRDWRDTLWPDQHLPVPTVPDLTAWMRAGSTDDWPGPRIDEACDRHPTIGDTAAELRDLRQVLRAATGETEPQPRRWLGLPCRNCRKVSMIARAPGEEYAECGGCGLMYSDSGLRDLLREWGGMMPQVTHT